MDGPSWADLPDDERVAAARAALPPGHTIIKTPVEYLIERENGETFLIAAERVTPVYRGAKTDEQSAGETK